MKCKRPAVRDIRLARLAPGENGPAERGDIFLRSLDDVYHRKSSLKFQETESILSLVVKQLNVLKTTVLFTLDGVLVTEACYSRGALT